MRLTRRAPRVMRLTRRPSEVDGRGDAAREAPVDDERLGRAEARVVGAEEERHRGDLLRPADAAEGVHLAGGLARGVRVVLHLEVALRHARVDVARADAVAADLVAAVLERD